MNLILIVTTTVYLILDITAADDDRGATTTAAVVNTTLMEHCTHMLLETVTLETRLVYYTRLPLMPDCKKYSELSLYLGGVPPARSSETCNMSPPNYQDEPPLVIYDPVLDTCLAYALTNLLTAGKNDVWEWRHPTECILVRGDTVSCDRNSHEFLFNHRLHVCDHPENVMCHQTWSDWHFDVYAQLVGQRCCDDENDD